MRICGMCESERACVYARLCVLLLHPLLL
jgi:hypothetical protein